MADLARIKMVSALDGFFVNVTEITVDSDSGPQMSVKSIQLRMILIAFCLLLQDFSGKQAFPPQGDESPRIKVSGM
jgi:hypothetical protein